MLLEAHALWISCFQELLLDWVLGSWGGCRVGRERAGMYQWDRNERHPVRARGLEGMSDQEDEELADTLRRLSIETGASAAFAQCFLL